MRSVLEVTEKNFIKIKEPTLQETRQADTTAPVQKHGLLSSSVKAILDEAAIHLHLAYRRNTLLHYFFGSGMLAMAARRQKQQAKDKCMSQTC